MIWKGDHGLLWIKLYLERKTGVWNEEELRLDPGVLIGERRVDKFSSVSMVEYIDLVMVYVLGGTKWRQKNH